MSRYNRPNKSTNKDYAIRAVFGIVVVAILAILCPRDNPVKLHYNLGEPWNDNEIIAKDSFDLMGENVEPRKEFISANAKFVKNLDI